MIITEVVLLVEMADGVGVYGRVVVCKKSVMPIRSHIGLELDCMRLTHARLAQGHDGKDGPLLLGGEVVGRVLEGVCLVENQRGVGVDGRGRRGRAAPNSPGLFGTRPVGPRARVAG